MELMLHRRRYPLALLLAIAWFASGEARAQAHGPPIDVDPVDWNDPELRAAKLAEMDVWLRRLVGRYYNANNTIDAEDGRRTDCTGIGTGPGVQCMNAVWSSKGRGRVTQAQLFGFDTNSLQVNYMQVNNKGLPEGGMGKHSGDTLTLRFKCLIPDNAPNIISCENKLKFFAPPDSREVTVTAEITQRISGPGGTRENIIVINTFLMRVLNPEGEFKKTAKKPAQVRRR